jgi:hypothetical protein
VTTFKKITTGVLAAATLTAVASPADAQWRHRNRGDRTALAIGAGALGLAVGAAIASNNRRGGYYDGYYGRGYGRGGYDGYYGRPYAYNGYADGYGRPYGYGYGYRAVPRQRCWTDRQWDDWRGRWRRVRVCDRF